MAPFRWVRADQAGPHALGILVPPGSRTVLILRPRALAWDLLLVEGPASLAFRAMAQEEATSLVERVCAMLQEWAQRVHLDALPAPQGGYLVWVDLGELALVACARRPGQPYQPLVFPTLQGAREALLPLRSILQPVESLPQEVYINTRGFQR